MCVGVVGGPAAVHNGKPQLLCFRDTRRTLTLLFCVRVLPAVLGSEEVHAMADAFDHVCRSFHH
jgi:hypothetical protein